MLEKVLDQANSTSNSARQICINTGNSSSVIYTVPTGKTFSGYLTGNGQISINGAWLNPTTTPFPLTLISGTVVKNNNTSYVCTLMGVEQ